MNNQPKISIIMPVRNMSEYLEESIGSWRNQTMQEIEIICVDDASTDNSYEMLVEMAKEDSRIVTHRFEENGTAWMARKWGIANAKGEYILFADADDTMVLTACEELYAEMKQNPVDILHFDTEVINANNLAEHRIKNMERFVKPYDGVLNGEEVFTACFEKKLYQFNLWNKLFDAKLCKDSLANTKDMLLPKAQDKMAYWVIALNAKTYRGIPEKKYYNYFFGRGSTGQNRVTMAQFENYCKMGLTADAMTEYLADNDLLEKYSEIDKMSRTALFNDCYSRFAREVPNENKAEAFDLLIKYWGRMDVITKLAGDNWFNRFEAAKMVKGAKCLEFDKREVKTIGTYYHSCSNGGAQRVMCELALLWDSMGYNVVIFTDEEPTEEDYPLPRNAKRIVLPHHQTTNKNNYAERAQVIMDAVREYSIDAVVYHAWVLNMMLWDEIVFKLSNVAFIGHCHNIFSLPLLKNYANPINFVAPYLLADAVVTLSDTDKKFWQHWNNNVTTTLNPFTDGVEDWSVSEKLDAKQILWIGRMSGEKRPEDALKIMKEVVATHPDAHMHIVGASTSEKYMEYFEKRINDLELQDNITMHGYQTDVRPYYGMASVFLMTSEYEGFSLTLQESKLAGLPTVMYDLPYLVLTEGNRGIVPVKMMDYKSAAAEIVELLSDDEKRHTYSQQARQHIEELFGFDFTGTWDKIIKSVGKDHEKALSDYDYVLMETLYSHANSGIMVANKKSTNTPAPSDKYKKYYEDMKNSASYRIGRVITAIPRFIRDIIKSVLGKK